MEREREGSFEGKECNFRGKECMYLEQSYESKVDMKGGDDLCMARSLQLFEDGSNVFVDVER